MAEQVLMIALSPTMENGLIAKWNKKEGDKVESGDVLCEVETDKATMDYEASDEGTLLKIIKGQGTEAGVGEPIAILGEPGEDIAALLKEIETASSKSTAPAPQAEVPSDTSSTTSTQAQEVNAPAKSEPSDGRVKSSPLARKIASQKGLNLNQVQGSGPGGRIVKRDVESAQVSTHSAATPFLSDQVFPLSQKRKIIAQRLAESKFTAPHYYLKLSIQMDGVVNSRKAYNATAKEKLSMNAFLIKFVTEALKRNPVINSSWKGDSIVQHGSVDVGLAVAQPDGLITPVVRSCNNKGIIEIDQELKVLIDKARNNRLQSHEFTNATFTISSLGSFGIEEFTAIINPPGAAILAIGMIKKEPVVAPNGELIVQSNMKVSLSCDHRVIDGAVGAKFLNDLKGMMENPLLALL